MELNYTIVYSVLFGVALGVIIAYVVFLQLAEKVFEFVRKNTDIKAHISVIVLQAQEPLQTFIHTKFNLSVKDAEAVAKWILQKIAEKIKGS